ncbi:two-component response regulator-like APRR2 isoform X1 [Tanacetum coccineum]
MADHFQKWYDGAFTRIRSSNTSDGLAAIQAQLNNLGMEINKEEGKTLEEAYYTQFGVPFLQVGRYRSAGLGFNQRDNGNPTYQERRQMMEELLSKFMAEFEKRHNENSNLIRKIRASTDAVIKNQGASIKLGKIARGKVEDRSRDQSKDERALPDYSLDDLGASVSVVPYSTFTNLGLGKLTPTKLIIVLADKTVKRPKGIVENVLVGIDKFIFLVDFIVLDMPEDTQIPFILGRPFLSTAYAKTNVFKRKITLRVGNDKIVFKSDSPTSNIIKKVYALGLRERMELDLEAILMGEALILNRSEYSEFGDFIKLDNLNEPLELRNHEIKDLGPTIEEGEVIDEPKAYIVETRNDDIIIKDIDEYLKNMDVYHDKDMGDVFVGKPFCNGSCVEARRFDGLITIQNGNDSVTYQMERMHPSLFELRSEKSQVSRSWIRACICGFVAFSGILVSIEIKKDDQTLVVDMAMPIFEQKTWDLDVGFRRGMKAIKGIQGFYGVTLLVTPVMSLSTHPITILSDSNVEDAFSSTNTPDYTPASSEYFSASPGNTPSDSSCHTPPRRKREA